MDLSQSLSALLAIVVIDLVLAGDNAIVIALAARSLPAELQKRAILWGTAGAIVVRSLMTVIVVWLLNVPGLLLAGGLLLLWIAYRLLVPAAESGHAHGATATSFWGAMRTIVVADAVMGLDNVLAVAGAAHGSYLLVVLGLLISVPIVVWGSTVVLKVVDRFPAVVYVGAGVLVWTAVKMIHGEPLLAPTLAAAPHSGLLLYLAMPIVLGLGFLRNHRRLESRIHQRLAAFASQPPATGAVAGAVSVSATPSRSEGDTAMLKVLVPVDGSKNGLLAVRHAIDEYRRHHEMVIHLFNVQPRLSRHISRFVSRGERHAYMHDRADAALAGAAELVRAAGVPFHTHWASGARADEICRIATRLGVQRIVMGTARKNSITRMLEDSVTHRVLETTPVPVEVITGDAVSRWERWGLPAGVLGAGGLLLLAFD